MSLCCHICHKDLAGLDVEYHYSRNHGNSVEIPRGVLIESLRESNNDIHKLKTEVAELKRKLAAAEHRGWFDRSC